METLALPTTNQGAFMQNFPSTRPALDIPPDIMAAIVLAIQTLQANLQPRVQYVDPDQARALPKMGTRNSPFVDKTLGYAESNPQLCPPGLDVAKFRADRDAVLTLRGLQQPLAILLDMIEGSIKLSGADAYGAARAYYQSAKDAAKRGLPGAASIADDLSEQFADRAPRAKLPPPPVTPGAGSSSDRA
jgi:hypothetical protein